MPPKAGDVRLCRALISMFCVAAALVALPGFAQEAPAQESPTDFDIPMQPLATALEAFSAASRYQILTAETELGVTRSNAVKGVMPPREALARISQAKGSKQGLRQPALQSLSGTFAARRLSFRRQRMRRITTRRSKAR